MLGVAKWLLGGRPAWLMPYGPAFDIDFANARAWNGSSVVPPESLLTTSRSSSADVVDDLVGNWRTVPANAPRISNKGLLIEAGVANQIRNNSMQGAVVGTPGTLPTNWAVNAAAGLATNVIGFGTAQGIDYIDVQITGTSNATLYVLSFDQITAAVSSVWATSFFQAMVGGSLANIVDINVVTNFDGAGSVSSPFTPTATLTRSFSTATAGAATTFVRPQLNFDCTNATAINITMRIGWPQCELNGFSSSPIRTTGTTVTRAGDLVNLTVNPVMGAGMSAFVVYNQKIISTGDSYMWQATDGTSANVHSLFQRTSTGKAISQNTFIASVNQGIQSATPAWASGVDTKVAFAALSDRAVTTGGAAVSVSTLTGFSGWTTIWIGSSSGASSQPHAYIKRLAMWPTVRLPNEVLQDLTR